MRKKLTNGLMMGLAICWLIHFVLMAYYGEILCGEPNALILRGEILASIGIIILGILNARRLKVIKVEVLKEGKARTFEFICPICGRWNSIASTEVREGKAVCWSCKSELKWEEIDG